MRQCRSRFSVHAMDSWAVSPEMVRMVVGIYGYVPAWVLSYAPYGTCRLGR